MRPCLHCFQVLLELSESYNRDQNMSFHFPIFSKLFCNRKIYFVIIFYRPNHKFLHENFIERSINLIDCSKNYNSSSKNLYSYKSFSREF